MSKENPRPPSLSRAAAQTPLSLPASESAPFIYFDSAANYGVNNGVAQVTLEAGRALSIDGRITRDRVVVAHLRMSVAAAMSLRAALNGVAMLVAPQVGQESN